MEVVTSVRRVLKAYNKALQAQAWLLGLKEPDQRPRTNLFSYMREHQTETTTSDAAFVANEARKGDLIALTDRKTEPMGLFLERYLYPLFEVKASDLWRLCTREHTK